MINSIVSYSVSNIALNFPPDRKNQSERMKFGEKAEAALAGALHHLGREFKINEGDGAFYGPKLISRLRMPLEELGNVEPFN